MKKFNYYCESGKYRKVMLSDKHDFCIITNKIDSTYSLCNHIQVSNNLLPSLEATNIILTDDSTERLYFALKKFYGEEDEVEDEQGDLKYMLDNK